MRSDHTVLVICSHIRAKLFSEFSLFICNEKEVFQSFAKAKRLFRHLS